MGAEELTSTNSSMSGNSTNSNAHTNASPMKNKIQRGGISESSTTSDNTTDFIEIVKKHDIIYNTHHPDYKNIEAKLKVWTQIAEEIGLSVDASKRKWKNLRDSYTKYLRSFRVGTKTSKKYQFWAHAEHMDFLKPYQGPGRSSTNTTVSKDEEDNECDLGFQVLSKATTNTVDEDEMKQNSSTPNNNQKNSPIGSVSVGNMLPNYGNNGNGVVKTSGIGSTTSSNVGGGTTRTPVSGTIMLPIPSLPTVQLPPSLTAKPILSSMPPTIPSSSSSAVSTMCSTSHSYNTTAALTSLTTTSMPSQVFALPQLSAKGPVPMPSSNTASSVGCLIIEPQLFASADTFKKEFNSSPSVYTSSSSAHVTSSGLQIYPNVSSAHGTGTSQNMSNRLTPSLITKIRRVQPSPQSSAINLSFSTTPSSSATSSAALSSYPANGYSTLPNSFVPVLGGATTIAASTTANGGTGQPPIKKLKSADVDISAILQANRDLDANTLFFLSLARSVRSMPTKFQALAKMRCMRIVSDIELELDNINNEVNNSLSSTKYCTNDSDSPPTAVVNNVGETQKSEHFVYVMSPSRVESMIDLSSDDENPATNGN